MFQNSKSGRSVLLAGCAVAAICLATTSYAQDAQSNTAPAQSSNGLDLESVVVTGSSQAIKKFDAPYAISTVSAEQIQQAAPKSMVDLLRAIPGITVENSGGEGGGENTVIRGLPYSGFRLLDVQVDGLPLFESNYERQLQIDELYRVDLNTTGLEAVRGGTSSIFSNNAAGGVINFRTNHGTQDLQRSVKFSTNDHSQARLDAAWSGPVPGNSNLLYSVSGFYRFDNGLRNPGFQADRGGQFQVGGTYLLGDQGKITADVRYLNDRTIFYTDIPLSNPTTGASLSGLINPSYGTLDSASARGITVKSLDGNGNVISQTRDLANGIHPQVITGTVGFDWDWGNGWSFSDKARYTDGTVSFDAILNGAPTDAQAFLNSRLSAAQSAFAGTTGLQYVLRGTNTAFDPATTQGFIMPNTYNATNTHYTELMNDARANWKLDSAAVGRHDVTFGVSLGKFSFNSVSLNDTIIENMKNQPDVLDVQAVNASGAVTGYVTDGGINSYGAQLAGQVHGLSTALYATETWHITDALQVDADARFLNRHENGNRGILGKLTSATGALADRSITGLTGYAPYTKDYNVWSWTVGGLYQINDAMNVFARYSSTYSLPKLSDMWTNNNCGSYGVLPNCQSLPVLGIRQAEGGLKVSISDLQVFVTGFYSHFNNFSSSTYVMDVNPSSSTYQQLVSSNLYLTTTSYGAELEASWHPVDYFELNGSAVFQDPQTDRGVPFNSGLSAASLVGKQLARVPHTTYTLQPTLFFDVAGMPARLFGTYFYEGRRYQDVVQTGILQSFNTVDLGASLQVTDMVGIQIQASNLTNSTGLTEGNARGAVANTLTPAVSTVGRPIFGRVISGSVQVKF